MAVVAYLLFVEARRSVGVKATRIFLASAGTGLLGSSFALASIGGWFASFAVSSTPITGIVQGIALICYYVAFATPRFLLTRWRRAEQAKYLETVNERDPEERGQRASDDVFRAAGRGAGGSVTFVALRSPSSPATLEITASSNRSLVGQTVANRHRPHHTGARVTVWRLTDCRPTASQRSRVSSRRMP